MNAAPAYAQNKFVTPALLILFAMLVCLRMPKIIIEGRFWAEEGTIFFHNAWVLPPAQALLTSFGGYLNLVANAAALATRFLLPLRLAPYLTIAVGLLFQLCPPLLLLTARDSWLGSMRVRVAALLLLLLITGAEEVWLHTLHCQFQLALCCGIILALEAEQASGRLLRYALLLLAPLCGPGAIALLPLFFARAALDRSLPRLWQAATLALGAAIQLALFFQVVPGRRYSLDPITLLDVFTVRHLYIPFLGVSRASVAAPVIQAYRLAGHVPLPATLLPIAVFVPFLAATLWCRRDRTAFWLLAAGGLLACASYFGALGGAAALIDTPFGARYSFAPQALFNLSVLALTVTAPRWIAVAARGVVLWLLIIGAAAYFHPSKVISKGPSWRAEIAAWQADPSHKILLWPRGWSMSLEALP